MIDEIRKDAAERMKKSIEVLRQNLSKIRTGRAHTSLVDHIQVPYYGSDVPLTQVASVAVTDARTLTITPWEKNMVAPIEKALMASDLGVTPNTAGTTIRIILPPLTEERRRDLVKVVRHEGENAKVAVRAIRRDANDQFKQLEKEKLISEDQVRKAQDDIQKVTDDHIAQVDRVLEEKEQELMQI
ncbi:ribosome recycling factor [Candidatus Macondimonas diazotrophica]|jgi:ribosome recycling factor|uniref:Ribosome-recycling factor n=1 Tax=Candidatus Macondimonas diazotrophica TaxID=2305248 RepID=A0A4Z0FBH5_9GAMM|nr:ribosome recycling factor [Candidatus Macondimonas diazotrophica]HBG30337.1 ribosome recycling factor [Gammaproteobacteria bacterium]NCU00919.1 ribosome recycling factor [Candidatus Macondimonas diazotrophica]TFZ83253.1 ribosome recycling factor [Candidatus Macondimonas diazotrophica]HBG52086.1 ribosome recycling factor [Gammaproteobacteria bacterium]HCO44257.1 ribosome recycling factor [Gammaproteobacteria bacterium]